jgi:hypothetical protein
MAKESPARGQRSSVQNFATCDARHRSRCLLADPVPKCDRHDHARRLGGGGSIVARGEQVAEEAAGEEKDDAGCSSQSGVHEPEINCRHFFEKTAEPADEIIRRE